MPTPPTPAGGVVYFQKLFSCPQRLPEARAVLGDTLDIYLKRKEVRIVQSLLGPLVTLDTAGLRVLGLNCKPLSCASVTDQLAAHEAYALALERGYTVMHVSRTYLRLRDPHGREHLLYIRTSLGLPSSRTVRSLIKKHTSSLRRTGGTVILYVVHEPRYQGHFSNLIQFWVASSSPLSIPERLDTSPASEPFAAPTA